MKRQFTIGEISKISNLSKQTLIFYDKSDVFKPKIIDENNGYRYYTSDQLEVLDTIMILKELGLSLSDIKVFMNNRNKDNTISLLKQQYEEIDKKINHLQLISKRLNRKLLSLENICDINKITLSHENEMYLFTEAIKAPNNLVEVDLALKRLFKKSSSYPHYYQIGDIVTIRDNKLYYKFAFLPLESKVDSKNIQLKPAGLYAKYLHVGAYHDVILTYQTMLTEIKEMGYTPISDAYEFSIIDNLTTKNDDDYVTEIQIQVKKI